MTIKNYAMIINNLNSEVKILQISHQNKDEQLHSATMKLIKMKEESKESLILERNKRIKLIRNYKQKLCEVQIKLNFISQQYIYLQKNSSDISMMIKNSPQEIKFNVFKILQDLNYLFSKNSEKNKCIILALKNENLLLIYKNQMLCYTNKSFRNQIQIKDAEHNKDQSNISRLSRIIENLNIQSKINFNEMELAKIQRKRKEELFNKYKNFIKSIEKGKANTIESFVNLLQNFARNITNDLSLIRKEKNEMKNIKNELQNGKYEINLLENKIKVLEKEKTKLEQIVYSLITRFLIFLEQIEDNSEEKRYLIPIHSYLEKFCKLQKDTLEELNVKEQNEFRNGPPEYTKLTEWIPQNYLLVLHHLNLIKTKFLMMPFKIENNIKYLNKIVFNFNGVVPEFNGQEVPRIYKKIKDNFNSFIRRYKENENITIEKKEKKQFKLNSEIRQICCDVFSSYSSEFMSFIQKANNHIIKNSFQSIDEEISQNK